MVIHGLHESSEKTRGSKGLREGMTMKLAISYFYQIRNFKKYMLPLSTAVSDPSWYHENLNNNHIFIDKRGIINGIRILPLHPRRRM